MKKQLELIIHDEPDNRKFINYWDYLHGEDVCCEIIDDELFKSEYDDNGNELPKRKITFGEFIKLIK